MLRCADNAYDSTPKKCAVKSTKIRGHYYRDEEEGKAFSKQIHLPHPFLRNYLLCHQMPNKIKTYGNMQTEPTKLWCSPMS